MIRYKTPEISQELKDNLMDLGLNKQQIESKATQKITEFYVSEKGEQILLKELQNRVNDTFSQCDKMEQELKSISETILGIADAQKKYGTLTDERAQNALILYNSLVEINQRAGTRDIDTVTPASYVVYAYLGGPTSKDIDITLKKEKEKDNGRKR